MKSLSQHSKIILAVASLIIGSIFGATAQDIISSRFRLLGAIVAVLSLGIVALVTGQAVVAESRRDSDKELVASANATLDETRKSLREQGKDLQGLSGNLQRRMKSLEAQIGMRVERLLLAEVNSMDVLDEDASAQLIYSVQRRLYVLDLISEDGRWPDEAMNQDLVSQYFTGLAKRIRESSPPLIYKRIFQVPNPNSSFPGITNSNLIDHCREILDLHRDRLHRVSVRVARQRFPFKIILIDENFLILQLQEYDSAGKAFKLWGELRISDPRRELIPIFREIWDQIDGDDESRSLTESDLPSPAAE
jgi:hypothetical protein